MTQFTLDAGDMIRSAVLYGTGKGDGLGHVSLSTGSTNFECGKPTDGIDPYPQDVGTGFLIGAWGYLRSDHDNKGDVSDLALLFLNTAVDYIEINNVQYDRNITGTQDGLQDILLSDTQFSASRNHKGNATFTWTGSSAQTNSRTFTQSSATKYGATVSVTISGEFLGIGASTEDSFSWETTKTQEATTSESDTITLQWTQSGSNAPGHSSVVSALAKEGRVNIGYSSNVTLHMQDGSSMSYTEKGQSNNVVYSEAFVNITSL